MAKINLRIWVLTVFVLLTSNILFSQDDSFKKTTVENSITFKGNADSVWQYLSDLGHLQFLVPSTIKSSITNGQGAQSIVTLTLQNGGQIVEKVVKFNAKKRIICYIMIETPLPIKDYLACFKVTNARKKEVKVTFKACFFVQDELREERIEAFEKLQKELLTNLKNFKHDK